MDLEQTTNNNGYKGLFWFAFSGAATFCAFFLPAFILILWLKTPSPNFIFIFYATLVILASLYHSFYRIKASDHDLKLIRSFIVWISVVTILIVIIQNV